MYSCILTNFSPIVSSNIVVFLERKYLMCYKSFTINIEVNIGSYFKTVTVNPSLKEFIFFCCVHTADIEFVELQSRLLLIQ